MMRLSPAAAAVARSIGSVNVQTDSIFMGGGLDVVTPTYQRKPGVCRAAQNFEQVLYGGYKRITGYERYDGQAKPSAATYTVLAATITGVPVVGDTLTGATSLATGVIIALPGGSFILTKVVGTFQSGENLQISAVTVAVATAAPIQSGASTPLLHAQYRNLAADQYRSDIAAVPGSGAILGVWVFNDVVYAFRNAVGGATAAMYKSTGSGWSQITLEKVVSYTVGSGAATIIDGGTLTQGGVTATIRRVLVQTGALASGTAAGTLVISTPVGGNFAAGAATVGAGTLTLSGAESSISLLPDGRYEFMNTNFGGSINTKRMYGCDGVNKAFEFDGTYFIPIPTGMTTDAPSHITEHKKHLFLSFVGSVQHSSTGTPYTWTAVLGAAELGMGDTVTGFAKEPGSSGEGALAIFTRNRMSILYGNSSSDWVLTPYREELGAFAHTIQDVGYTMFLDDRGITDLQQAQTYGNFAHNAISNQVLTKINEWRPAAVASCISRDASQYRIFFTNKHALYVTVAGRKIVGIMPMLLNDTVRCIVSAEMNDGSEAIFFGSDDGWVYQMEKGTSFDGDSIEAYINLAYNFQQRPRVSKRYRDATIEVTGSGYAQFAFGYSLGYGETTIPQPSTQTVTTNFSSVFWDSFTWDAFFWDGSTLSPNTVTIDGEAENISVGITSSDDFYEAFTVTSTLIHYTPRRRLR